MSTTVAPGDAPTDPKERFAPLLSKTRSAFTLNTAQEWLAELQEMQWDTMLGIFFSYLHGPPQDTLTKAYLKDLFDRADADENGTLDRDEISALVERAHVEAFRQQLSLLVSLAHMFAPRGREEDDATIEAELRRRYQAALEERQEAGKLREIADAFWDGLDGNGDGAVSRREFVAHYNDAFQQALGAPPTETTWDRHMWRPGKQADKQAYYRSSAADFPEAAYRLACLLAGEDGVPQGDSGGRMPREAALEEEYAVLLGAAKLGHAAARHRLASMYMDERVPQAGARAEMVRLEAAAACGDSVEVFCERQALRWFAEAARAGDTRACYKLGLLHIKAGRYPAAFEWLERASEGETNSRSLRERAANSDAGAMYELGVRKILGSAFERANAKEAVDLFTRSADGGDPRALYTMGLLSYVGLGGLVRKDERKGRDYWQLASNRGHVKAGEKYRARKEADEKDARERDEKLAADDAAAGTARTERGQCASCQDGGVCALM